MFDLYMCMQAARKPENRAHAKRKRLCEERRAVALGKKAAEECKLSRKAVKKRQARDHAFQRWPVH